MTDAVRAMAEALRPFAQYVAPVRLVPTDHIITQGSPLARKQITMGDCYRAADALAAFRASDTGGGDEVRETLDLLIAETNAPLTGRTHDAFDRGHRDGIRYAVLAMRTTLAALSTSNTGGGEDREALLGAVARGWCDPKNSHKVMDSDLAVAIADEVAAAGFRHAEAEGSPLPPAAIAGTDNGETVYLDSYSGGGHQDGSWSHLSLRFERPGAPDSRRTYTEDRAISALSTSSPIQEEKGDESPDPDVQYLTAALHRETTILVNSFAISLAHKLLSAQEKYGYTDGWKDNDWADKCRADLRAHVDKGDPLDVAAYAAFCWAHGWSTAIAPTPAPARGSEPSWLHFLPSDIEWLADHGRKMGPGVGAQAIERLLVALAHVSPTPIQEKAQTDLDRAWRAVDACGGTHNREDRGSGYAQGYDDALTFACTEIEKLGGRPS